MSGSRKNGFVLFFLFLFFGGGGGPRDVYEGCPEIFNEFFSISENLVSLDYKVFSPCNKLLIYAFD